jgi:hypothetical protein
MKSRMTLTIDPAVLRRAKALARERGRSLSGLVEGLLARETRARSAEPGGLSSRWAGRMTLADKPDRRFDALPRKSGL